MNPTKIFEITNNATEKFPSTTTQKTIMTDTATEFWMRSEDWDVTSICLNTETTRTVKYCFIFAYLENFTYRNCTLPHEPTKKRM